MSRTLSRRSCRAAAAVLTLALSAGLAACGSSGSGEDAGGSGSANGSPSPSSSTSADADPGDDLLQRPRVGVVFRGSESNATWRYPEGYETPEGPRKGTLTTDGVAYLIAVGYKADATREDAVAAIEQEASTTAGAADLEVGETEVAGRTFSTAVLSDDDSTLRAYYFTPEGGRDSYQLIFQAAQAPDEVPAERLEEFQQFLGSFELKSADDLETPGG